MKSIGLRVYYGSNYKIDISDDSKIIYAKYYIKDKEIIGYAYYDSDNDIESYIKLAILDCDVKVRKRKMEIAEEKYINVKDKRGILIVEHYETLLKREETLYKEAVKDLAKLKVKLGYE